MGGAIFAIAIVIPLVILLPFSGRAHATATVDGHDLRVVPVGLSKLWALRRQVVVPAASVTAIETRPDMPKVGARIAGTGVPRVCAAGYFRTGHTKSFLVVGRSRPLVEITLTDAKYERILFSADDPNGLVRSLRTKLGSSSLRR